MSDFRLVTDMKPCGDQPPAIDKLAAGLAAGRRWQTLLGVTGSGKTFTMANVIARAGRPALIISHNKTLAAQLYSEFKEFFPDNAVHYFVSYYDYYQPEAYIPQRDIYIEKDSDINEDIDRLRLAATSALMSRKDVVIVASVSCIYGLGSPQDYAMMVVGLKRGQAAERQGVLKRLVEIQYERNEIDFSRGKFRVRGETMDVFPSYEQSAIRIVFDGDIVESIERFHPLKDDVIERLDSCMIFPAKHFVMPQDRLSLAFAGIEKELAERTEFFRSQGKLLEAQRIEARTKYDLELMREVGYCKGIENYTRHLSGLMPGQHPYTLIDFFPKDFICFVDESHVTVPQLNGMYNGDHSRKQTLVDFGFRLPSAMDNRPMRFEEWEAAMNQVVFVSATPAPFELKRSGGATVEQIIRPTGLVDPAIIVRKARGQVKDLLKEIKARVARKERALVTTLTKRLAEDLSGYFDNEGVKCQYLHSDVQTIERVQILKELREGKFDVLVGVNLLREGLDLPEVSLVAILDADKEGFLRSTTSIIQTVGRTARNVNGVVILYADTVTDSMKRAMDETERRRTIQLAYNKEHGITPKTIQKEIRAGIESEIQSQKMVREIVGLSSAELETSEMVLQLEKEMYEAAKGLDFEKAARLRDTIRQIGAGTLGGGKSKRKPRFRVKA
jgi:excinuclease ABC subunit B